MDEAQLLLQEDLELELRFEISQSTIELALIERAGNASRSTLAN